MGRRRRGLVSTSNEFGGANADMPGFVNDDFDECMERFIRNRRASGRSPETIRYYREQLTFIRDVFEKQKVTTRLNRITQEMIIDHLIDYSLVVRKNSRTTLNSRLRALRAFLNWAIQQGIIPENPMNGITISNKQNRVVETYTREQLRDLFQQPNLETFVGLRDYAIMTILLETGIRVRELTDIKLNDIRWEDSQIVI